MLVIMLPDDQQLQVQANNKVYHHKWALTNHKWYVTYNW